MKILLLPAILLLLCISCKKENNIKTSPNLNLNNTTAVYGREAGNTILVESDYLYFEDGDLFKSTIDQLEKMEEKDRLLWEQKFDRFRSMNTEFNENLVKDTLHFWRMQYIDKIEQDQIVNHCDEIQDTKYMYVKYFFDRKGDKYEEYTEEGSKDEEYLLLKNISLEKYAFVVNRHGIVKIGNILYQFTHEWIKSLENAKPENVDDLINARLNAGGGIEFHSAMQDPVIDGAVQSGCDFPGYYNNNSWGVDASVEFSDSPRLRLFLKGSYYFQNDYYCPALYTPCVKVYADPFKKCWYNINWVQDPTPTTLEVSYTYNHPNGTSSNVYSFGSGSGWRLEYFNSWPIINSQSFTAMFNVSNFYARATRNGGPSGAATTISH